jgi:hypothetical protein
MRINHRFDVTLLLNPEKEGFPRPVRTGNIRVDRILLSFIPDRVSISGRGIGSKGNLLYIRREGDMPISELPEPIAKVITAIQLLEADVDNLCKNFSKGLASA